jgi:hypothetical protein
VGLNLAVHERQTAITTPQVNGAYPGSGGSIDRALKGGGVVLPGSIGCPVAVGAAPLGQVRFSGDDRLGLTGSMSALVCASVHKLLGLPKEQYSTKFGPVTLPLAVELVSARLKPDMVPFRP